MTLPASYVQFAVYETFAPTILRGKVVLVSADDAAWGAGLPAVVAMECARIGAHLALHAATPVYEGVARDIVAYGRPVAELAGLAGADAAAAAAIHYGRIDVTVHVGEDEATVAAACRQAVAQGDGCVVWLAPVAAEHRVPSQVTALQAGMATAARINAVIATLPGDAMPGPDPQELAWQAIFLASAAGAGLRGHCLRPVARAVLDATG